MAGLMTRGTWELHTIEYMYDFLHHALSQTREPPVRITVLAWRLLESTKSETAENGRDKYLLYLIFHLLHSITVSTQMSHDS